MAHRVAPQAAADLDDIWYYVAIESGNVEIADRFVDSITERFFLLAGHPYLGRPRDDDLGMGLRSFVVGEYVIVYLSRIRTCSFFAWCTAGAIWKSCSGRKAPHTVKRLCRMWWWRSPGELGELFR